MQPVDSQPTDNGLADNRQADSRYAWTRLACTLALMTIGSSAMYVVAVVLPAVQAEFGTSRSDASLPYTLMMVGFGLGGIAMGRLADKLYEDGEINLDPNGPDEIFESTAKRGLFKGWERLRGRFHRHR